MFCRSSKGTRNRARTQRGATALWLVVIFTPVLLGLAGFALDLGMLYSAKGELKTAANAMALAAAQNLIGTDAATGNAQNAAMLTVQGGAGGNRYNFQGTAVGQGSGNLTSTISDPAYFSAAADAIASTSGNASEAASSQAKYVRYTVTGDTPLIFFGLLPTGVNPQALRCRHRGCGRQRAPMPGLRSRAFRRRRPQSIRRHRFRFRLRHSLHLRLLLHRDGRWRRRPARAASAAVGRDLGVAQLPADQPARPQQCRIPR